MMQKQYPISGDCDKELHRFIGLVKKEKTKWEQLQIIRETKLNSEDEAKQFFENLRQELLQTLAHHFFLLRDQHGFDVGKLNLGEWPFTDKGKSPAPAIYDLLAEYKFCHNLLENLHRMIETSIETDLSLFLLAPHIIQSLNQQSCRIWPIIVFNLRPSWAVQSERYLLLLAGWLATRISLTTKTGATKRIAVALSRQHPGLDARQSLLGSLPGIAAEIASTTTDAEGNISSYLNPDTLFKLPGKAEYAIEQENLSVEERLQEGYRTSTHPLKGPKPEQSILENISGSLFHQLEEWKSKEDYSFFEAIDWLNSVGLTDKQLKVFNLYSIEKKSAAEVGEILGMKSATVRSTDRAVREKLKPVMALAIKNGEMGH